MRDEGECPSKYECQKLRKLYTHGAATDRSLQSLEKDSNLPVSLVRQFLHSKPSYTKFAPATQKFKKMKAFVRFKNKVWCMDLACVEKIAKDKKQYKMFTGSPKHV